MESDDLDRIEGRHADPGPIENLEPCGGNPDVPGAFDDPIPRSRREKRGADPALVDQALHEKGRGGLAAGEGGSGGRACFPGPDRLRAQAADGFAKSGGDGGPEQPSRRFSQKLQPPARRPQGAQHDPARRSGVGEVTAQRAGHEHGSRRVRGNLLRGPPRFPEARRQAGDGIRHRGILSGPAFGCGGRFATGCRSLRDRQPKGWRRGEARAPQRSHGVGVQPGTVLRSRRRAVRSHFSAAC